MPVRPSLPRDRAQSTRAAIIDAFAGLARDRRYDAIRIADILRAAAVGRSTFYEHFRGKDALLLAAMEPLLLALATAASGRAARPYVRAAVQHLWDRRAVGRALFASSAAPLLQRRLAQLIRPHGERAGLAGGEASVAASGIAAAQLAMLRAWLAGEASASVDAVADRLIACAGLLGSVPARR